MHCVHTCSTLSFFFKLISLSGPVHIMAKEFENVEQVILDSWLRKSLTGKSHYYHDFSISSSFSLKSVFKKFHFRDGLEWTVGLTIEITTHKHTYITFIYPWIFRVAYAANISKHLTIIYER